MLLVMILMIFGMRVKCNEWNDENNNYCPVDLKNTSISCSCDLPHTLRCTGDKNSLEYISIPLAQLSNISLFDYTILNVTYIPARILSNITLHGLVITSGEIAYLHRDAFSGLNGPLQALGLPNNLLDQVPSACLQSIPSIQRLDLSHNRIRKLTDLSFKNLLNLTFLDLSYNLLGSISADAFASVPKLQVLILRENRISSSHMYSLQGLQSLRKLDLSSNVIVGPLHSMFAPRLPLLSWFSMSKNQLSSIRRDALSGFSQLITLLLQDNHIDVIEDFAFRSISQLNYLDLSYNRIVAISNSSLAFLSKLSTLDISHNFLRTVTNDLISPLRELHELHLDDNDISFVASDALHSVVHLNRLTMSENPLNCDCSVIYFATWLNSSNLTQEDRSTAVCATPPSFENALLADLSITDLVCPSSTELLTSLSWNYTVDNNSPFISLHAYNYAPSEITLIWNIEKEMLPYTCDTLVTYENLDGKEVLLESRHIECNSSYFTDGTSLPITLTSSVILDGHLYRFCITLLQELSIARSACSRILAFSNNTNNNNIQNEIISEYIDKIDAVLITPGTLNVTLKLRDIEIERCLLSIRIYNLDELLTEQTVNCSNIHVINNVIFSLSYRICISFSNNTFNPVCTWVYSNDISRNNANHIVLIVALFCLFLIFLGIFLYGVYCTRCRFKTRLFNSNNYLFPPVTYNQENASYSKLQAVTTL